MFLSICLLENLILFVHSERTGLATDRQILHAYLCCVSFMLQKANNGGNCMNLDNQLTDSIQRAGKSIGFFLIRSV